jgi:hypothetical protein
MGIIGLNSKAIIEISIISKESLLFSCEIRKINIIDPINTAGLRNS